MNLSISMLIFLPIVGSLFVMFSRTQSQAKITACLVAFINFVLSILLYLNFDYNLVSEQFVEKHSWIKAFNVEYFVGLDGISLLMIMLTTFITFLALLYSSSKVFRSKVYFVCFLILQAFAIGMFSAYDAMLFYIFFEAMLIPMFLIIGAWGSEDRIRATFKFILYTIFGSFLFLVAILYMYNQFGSFNLLDWQINSDDVLSSLEQKWLFWALIIAFAIKIPMLGLHSWLPLAHVQAPTSGSVVLAAVLLKLGAFAVLRFIIPVLPLAVEQNLPIIMALSVAGIVYASLLAYSQTNLKKMIAYSSIAQMGFVCLGLFSASKLGINGAIMQMISHGLVIAGLFFSVGIIYSRIKTLQILDMGDLVRYMPKLSCCFMIFSLANIGLPFTSGFIGKFTILLGIYQQFPIIAVIATFGVFLTACYMLKLYKDAFYKQADADNIVLLKDIGIQESIVLFSLVFIIILLGVVPNLLFNISNLAVKSILELAM